MLHDPLFVVAAMAAAAALAFWLGYHVAGRHHRKIIDNLQSPALDDIRWCYRNLLFREPESPNMVLDWAARDLTFDDMAALFITSDEFAALPHELQYKARQSRAQRREEISARTSPKSPARGSAPSGPA